MDVARRLTTLRLKQLRRIVVQISPPVDPRMPSPHREPGDRPVPTAWQDTVVLFDNRRVDVSPLQQMLPRCPNILNVNHRVVWQLVLNARIICKRRRHLALEVEGDQPGGANNTSP